MEFHYLDTNKNSKFPGSSHALNPVYPSRRCCQSEKKIGEKIKKTKRNFLSENIVDVIRKVPPLPKHRVQDSRNGHVIVLDKAGLEPTYVSKKVLRRLSEYII